MKLTEAKFLISDISKHQRGKRTTANTPSPNDGDLGPEGLEFGPNEYKLGSIKELNSRRDGCPFCRLAISSLREQCESYIAEKPEERRTEDMFYSQKATVPCFASWQIDGRMLVRDKEGKILPLKSKACTRRIRLRWGFDRSDEKSNSGGLFDTYVVLVAPRTGEKGLFLGRPIDTVKTDAALILRWTALCESSHGDLCRSRGKDVHLSKSFFGVIDVKEMCLVKLPPGQRYIALSYTWGNAFRNFQTKKENIRSLLKSGSLRQQHTAIPRTIRDAINLVTDLGERYLWVDALCIIQDSDRSWALNSRVMDIVYGSAYLTICAADGDNSNAGLKGLHSSVSMNNTREDLRRQNIAQYNQDIRLMSTQPAENYIKHSPWNTRGWTFQERLLSARNIIFVAGRMYFQCRCTARSCDIITEDEDAGWSIEFKDSPLLMLADLSRQPLSVYKKSLELYMTRKLTHQKDILAAFTGIGNLVCGALGGSLVFGLPSSHFDWALLWEPRDAANRRRREENEEFPSWSWCGWKNEVMEYKEPMLAGCEDNLHDWLMHHTWITWYIRDGNGNLRLVWDGDTEKMTPRPTPAESRWRGYCRVQGDDDKVHDEYGRPIKDTERNLKRSDDFRLILDECPYDVNIIEKVDTYDRNSTEKDMPFLQFFTWRAFFRIRADLKPRIHRKFTRYSIVDYKDDWCGTILLDKFWVPDRDLEQPLEFIAISDAKQFSKEEYSDWANYIPLERQESTWDLFYVLLITYENGIAYRQGLGKVFKDAFDNSCKPEGKQWEEFILG
jgi:hypothetical protein